MEKLQQFDKILQEDKDFSYQRLLYRFLCGIFVFNGIIMFLTPFDELNWKEDLQIILLPIVFLTSAIWLYMTSFLQVGNAQHKTAIYDLLRYIPVSQKEFRQNRRKIMLRFVCKLTFAIFCMQVIGSFIAYRNIGVSCFLYPVVIGIWLLANGWLQMLLATSKTSLLF